LAQVILSLLVGIVLKGLGFSSILICEQTAADFSSPR
jgi:hypothetical protein